MTERMSEERFEEIGRWPLREPQPPENRRALYEECHRARAAESDLRAALALKSAAAPDSLELVIERGFKTVAAAIMAGAGTGYVERISSWPTVKNFATNYAPSPPRTPPDEQINGAVTDRT